ncbi:response regulator [Bradyrhizobium sp. CCGUVB14]|uniref:response regulator n=1 Tax=Bradyrhizobium sp. CCGUVB14 TaxID=2949628 RepID=UPI0020B31B99|nr:response regulator [Bradyrhizobium sp. CCGUVB14]MCP3440193.1 response regulator [Bradyrhizobium sp. CCGUVB14]
MKTEYDIIWVDDDLESVADDITDIREFFEKVGIEARIQTYEGGNDGLHELIKAGLANPELDLIVVDFMMNGMNGRQLIDAIRTSDHIFLPVVFYSSAGSERLHQEAAAAALDGVYISSRDRVRRKIEDVVTSLLRKEQTTKRTRGLLMEGVSEIDASFGQLFHGLWSKLSDEEKDKVVTYFNEKLGERAVSAAKAQKDLPAEREAFKKSMESTFVSAAYDTSIRWKILKKMLTLAKRHEEDASKVFFRLFDDPRALVQMRNNYGHRTRVELEKDHTEEKCIAIRRELRAQTVNLVGMIKGAGS